MANSRCFTCGAVMGPADRGDHLDPSGPHGTIGVDRKSTSGAPLSHDDTSPNEGESHG